MLILSLSLLSATLTGALIYGVVRYRRLNEQLISRTERLLYEIDGWRSWQERVQNETGLNSVGEVIRAYRKLCGGIGYSLHNWTTEQDLTPERSVLLGGLGNLLREVASSRRLNREEPPQVKGWLPDRQYGTGRMSLEWAGPEFGPILDGLTLQQLIHVTVMLLDKRVSLEQAFLSIDICLLTPDRWWAQHTLENYTEAAAKQQEQSSRVSRGKQVKAEYNKEEAGWRALVQPRKDAQEAWSKHCLEQQKARYVAAETPRATA